MRNSNLVYQYHVHLWGGFYNEEYQKIHGNKPGDYFFLTLKEREDYIIHLTDLESTLNARHLAMNLTEGYCCGIRTKLHRVTGYKGVRYYSEYDMGVNYPMSAAKYHITWKWTLGFNDYPLGEDFNYNDKSLKVIQEWITGAEQEIEIQ